MWLGVYREPATARTYICLLPCVVVLVNESDIEGEEMSRPLFRLVTDQHVALWCPACERAHTIHTGPNGWAWDEATLTVSPSILVQHPHWEPPVTPDNLADWKRQPWEQHQVVDVCHSFLRDGVWEFLSDCTHALVGQKAPMVPWPESLSDT